MVAALSPAARADAIAKMAERELDVLVVGGGVVGAGSALDAVTRGLSTAIIEARDWASGTSSRSSKLMHGGLRYLEMLDFGLVNEALHERGLLLNVIAPHLVRPVRVPVPAAAPDLGAALRRGRDADLRRHGPRLRHRQGAQASPSPDPQGRAARGPVPAGRLAHRRHPVHGRAGGRRQAHDDGGAHGRHVRRAGRQPGAGDRLPAPGRARHRRHASPTS